MRKALTTTKGKMNVLDELDAICSEKLLSLEKEFDSLVAHADFSLTLLPFENSPAPPPSHLSAYLVPV